MYFEFEDIKNKVNTSISKLRGNDSVLLKKDYNERLISCRLADYLRTEFKEWDVDCESNRRFDGDPKKLNVPGKNNPRISYVTPDITINSRETPDNLLVIEIKKSNNINNDNHLLDQQKLIEFTSKKVKAIPSTQYNYAFGLLLIFPVGETDYKNEPLFEWYIDGKKLNDF